MMHRCVLMKILFLLFSPTNLKLIVFRSNSSTDPPDPRTFCKETLNGRPRDTYRY